MNRVVFNFQLFEALSSKEHAELQQEAANLLQKAAGIQRLQQKIKEWYDTQDISNPIAIEKATKELANQLGWKEEESVYTEDARPIYVYEEALVISPRERINNG